MFVNDYKKLVLFPCWAVDLRLALPSPHLVASWINSFLAVCLMSQWLACLCLRWMDVGSAVRASTAITWIIQTTNQKIHQNCHCLSSPCQQKMLQDWYFLGWPPSGLQNGFIICSTGIVYFGLKYKNMYSHHIIRGAKWNIYHTWLIFLKARMKRINGNNKCRVKAKPTVR